MGGFTQRQYEYARNQASALEYALSRGYDLIEKGRYYVMCEHDSMVFTDDGKWFWNSQGISGGAIEFAINYENKPFNEAVLAIAEGGEKIGKSEKSKRQSGEFILPPKAANCKKMFYYLCNVRGIDGETVKKLLKEHKIYQSSRGNAVFVSYDEQGLPKSAFERGTWTDKAYKHQVEFSDKGYPFEITAEEKSDRVGVFESCIDAMSYAALKKAAGEECDDMHLIAIGGQNDVRPIMYFLERHREVKKIYFCLDNDEAGRNGTASLIRKLKECGYSEKKGYSAYLQTPKAKDWNEDLLNYRSECSKIYERVMNLSKETAAEKANEDERE